MEIDNRKGTSLGEDDPFVDRVETKSIDRLLLEAS